MTTTLALGAEIMSRIDDLAAVSESPDGLSRQYLTPEHRRANDLVGREVTRKSIEPRGAEFAAIGTTNLG